MDFKTHDALIFPNVTLFFMHLLINVLASKRPSGLSDRQPWPLLLHSRLANKISEKSSKRR